MNSSLSISKNPEVRGIINKLPSSKSISNRALLLNALSGGQSVITNLATARDTRLMKNLLNSTELTLDAMDAGTTMRFLTAYLAITNQHKILTGTPRMKERPIGLLVAVLRQVGAQIDYLEREGFPPLEIKSFGGQIAAEITLPGNVSSQYISAMMMVAPVMPGGLTIHLEGKTGSKPYISMTQALMAQFGIQCAFEGKKIIIPCGQYQPTNLKVEPDWSALSYWLAMVALADKAEVTLTDVSSDSIQGDRVIVEIMEKLGVKTKFDKNNAVLTKTEKIDNHLQWDFTDCPDLAQTVLPVCALKGVTGRFTGLESLFIKETDRIAALQHELAKVDAILKESSSGIFDLSPGHIPKGKVLINTYHDHRMAMGFAPWATQMDLEIEAPQVVNKSYPEFWDDLEGVGFSISKN